jgi:hypothetical protein
MMALVLPSATGEGLHDLVRVSPHWTRVCNPHAKAPMPKELQIWA